MPQRPTFPATSIAASPRTSYTDPVGGCGKLGVLAGLLFLPCVLQAQSELPDTDTLTYTIRTPNRSPAKVDLYATYPGLDPGRPGSSIRIGGWEVTVTFDIEKCEVYCTYRRLARSALLPPIATIRIYSGSEAEPAMTIVDPAGLRFPTVASTAPFIDESLGLVPKRLFAPVLVHGNNRASSTPPLLLGSRPDPTPASAAAAPLRI